MRNALRILFIEDYNEDYILICRALQKAGLIFDSERVLSLPGLNTSLEQSWDLILSDFHLPGFTAVDVLRAIGAVAEDTPVIVVSGAVREEDAADLMRLGARDFVRKDNLARLVPAILRELDETDQRKKRVTAELALARQTEELKSALARAESANAMKTAFLANMSHEIRTPVGAMMGFADLLADPDCSGLEKKEFHAIIRRNGDALLRLLNEILDLSKIEAGHLALDVSEFSLSCLLNDLLGDSQIRAQEKGLEITADFRLGPDASALVRTDGIRLRQILSNLLGNAMKFTEKGGVHLFAEKFSEGGIQFLRFMVRDTGIGIDSADQSQLFKAFSQADNSLTRKFGGTGLGLALSRRLAQALGGDVTIVASQPGVGSTFMAIVRDDRVADAIAAAAKPAAEPARALHAKPIAGFRILVADDSTDNQFLIQRALKSRGATVEIAGNGLQAIEQALAGHHDVVLMDLQMPELDGMSATRKLRAEGYAKPIIALTAHAMKENRDECMAVGFTDYVSKPINFTELVAALLASHRVELSPPL